MPMITFTRKLFWANVQKLSVWTKICFVIALLMAADTVVSRQGFLGFLWGSWIFGVFLGVTMEPIHTKILYVVPKQEGTVGKIFCWYNVWKSLFILIAFNVVLIGMGAFREKIIGNVGFWNCVLACNVAIHMYLVHKDLPLELIQSGSEPLRKTKFISILILIGAGLLQYRSEKYYILIICLLLLVEGLTRTYRRVAAKEIILLDYDNE